MSLFDFDGKHVSSRKVSLGGVRGAAKETREQLLKRTQLEREQRRIEQLKNKSAKLIQAVYRKSRVIREHQAKERAEWDQVIQSIGDQNATCQLMQKLARSLLFFYTPSVDDERLAYFCKLVLASNSKPDTFNFSSCVKHDKSLAIVQIRKLLAKCTPVLSLAPDVFIPFIEVYSSPSTYPIDASHAKDVVANCVNYVLSRNFFSHLRAFILSQKQHPNFNSNLIRSISLSVHLLKAAGSNSTCSDFLRKIMSIPFLTQNQVIPQIDDVISLISANVIATDLPLEENVCILYNLLPIFGRATNSNIMKGCIRYISALLLAIPKSVLFKAEVSPDDIEYDSDEEYEMDTTPDIPYRKELENQIIETLLDPHTIQKNFNALLSVQDRESTALLSSLYCRLYEDFDQNMKTILLSRLLSKTNTIKTLWVVIEQSWNDFLKFVDSGNPVSFPELSNELLLWSLCYNQLLIVQDDEEFFSIQEYFTLHKLRIIALNIKEMLCKMVLLPTKDTEPLCSVLIRLLNQLNDRNERQQFIKEDEWLTKEFYEPEKYDKYLNKIPFVVPFSRRVDLFRSALAQMSPSPFRNTPKITIRRQYILEDAFDGLSSLSDNQLRQKIRIKFIALDGSKEAGIDGGGLFKEFITETCKLGFNPEFGLFQLTPEKQLCPNPASQILHGENHLAYFRFLGILLAKAIYEGVLVDIPFASFFLAKLLGKKNSMHDLRSLDPELYKNLMKLKRYDGNVEEDFGLTFSCGSNEIGNNIVELTSGGKDIPVTNENRIQYIYLIAHYKLNSQIRRQSAAFLEGFSKLIKPELIRMFNIHELQLLIAGDQAELDLRDFRLNTTYGGGFTADSPAIQYFWEVVGEFTPEQQQKLLKFVTSCPRPPLLGFAHLYPKFCIYKTREDDHLPTASTCMNMLKMPAFPTKQMLKEKLLYAIESGAGFDLS